MTISVRNFQLWTIKFLFFLAGCYLCFFLQAELKLTAVVAAAITGLLGTFIPESKHIEKTHVHSTIYSGAFVAMGSRVVEAGPWQILLVSAVGSGIYFLTYRRITGIGGRLGLIAFISSLLGVALRYWL